MLQPQERLRFEQQVLPHLNAAVNLARWLLRNPADAEDVVQEAMLRAYRFFGDFRGADGRAWLLQIVRNRCYTWLEKRRPAELVTEFDEEIHQRPSPNPESLVLQADERQRLTKCTGITPNPLAGSARASGIRRLLLQGDQRGYGNSHGHGNVDAVARAREVAANLGRPRAKEASGEL